MACVSGLLITLSAVLAYSAYITWQVTGLRKLQTNLVDRNRKDSLQLLRIQNDLNLLAVAMRDMVSSDEPYPLTAWSAQFQRIRTDLDDAMRLEAGFAAASRTPEQSAFLTSSVTQFWDAVDRVFALARERKGKRRARARFNFLCRSARLPSAPPSPVCWSRTAKTRSRPDSASSRSTIASSVRSMSFWPRRLLAILLNGLSLIRWNRRLFARLAEISERRSELAQKLISTQESTLRYISRELHDEFGQILTADGIHAAPRRYSRARRILPSRRSAGSARKPCRRHSRVFAASRRRLHPVMLDEAGLESTLDWYIPTVERQTGIAISYEKQGEPFPVDGGAGVHIYRVLQEALNNVARHSGAKQAGCACVFCRARWNWKCRTMAPDFPERPKPPRHRSGGHARALRVDGRADRFFASARRRNIGAPDRAQGESESKAESYGKEDHSVARG